MMRYNNYHRHSHRSNIFTPDTHIKNEDYCKRAIELGHTTIFSTEHGYGGDIFEIVDLANKYNLNPIFAIEGYIVGDASQKDNGNYHIVIIPRNNKARKKLNLINSNANMNGYYYKPRIFLNELLECDKDDFFITTACCGGILKNEDSYNNIFIPLYNHFKNNIYLEVQTHLSESQIKINKKALELANELNIKMIHANDSHYIYPEDAKDRLQMLKGKGINYGEEDEYVLDYPSYDTIINRYRNQGILSENQIKESLESTLIFDDIKNISINKEIKMPNIYENLNVDERIKKLRDLILDGYKRIKELDDITKEEELLYQNAIKEEFKVIQETKQIHTMDYFLVNERIVDRAINKYGGYLTPTSRGSGGAFILNKMLGLTQLDRVRSEIPLYYERFMSTARLLGDNPPYTSSLPDLDFNVVDPEPFRKASKDYLGEHGCYWMIAYGTMKEGEAFRNTCRSKGLNFDDYNEIAKNLDEYREDEQWKDIIEEANKFNGTIISSSPHPCSNILFSGDLREELGIVKVGNTYCCPITSTEADEWHYLKNDYLTVSSIGLTKKTYDMLEKHVDTLYQLKNKLDDKVWDIYANGLTCAINQFDSPWATSMSKDYKPNNIKEVAMFNGAIRPNFNDYRDSFMSRDKTFTNGNKFLDDLFSDTDKYCLYQESLMMFFERLDIKPSESIGLIKKISKKKIKQEDFDKLVKRLKKAWLREVGNLDEFDETWDKIQTFMMYSYNTPHSLAMAYDSLYNAYLKAHHTLEFYSVTLEEYRNDEERTRRLTEELNCFNIKINNPQFRYSRGEYIPDKKTNSIYKGVGSLKFLNNQVADELYSLKDNKYNNFVELLKDIDKKTSLNARQLDILIRTDYFSEFGGSQKLLAITTLYNEIITKKQFNKGKLPCGVSEGTFRKYAQKETAKIFKDVDTIGLVSEISSNIPDKDIPLPTKLKNQIEYLGYIDYVNPELKGYAYVLEEDSKYTPKVKVYRIDTGETITYKISRRIYRGLDTHDIIYIYGDEEKFGHKKIGEHFDEKKNKIVPDFEIDKNKIEKWIIEYEKLNLLNK